MKYRVRHKESGDVVSDPSKLMLRADGVVVDVCYIPPREAPAYTVEWFTGDKDINGVDVYAEDIIRTPHFITSNGKQEYLYHKVIFNPHYSAWWCVNQSDPDGVYGHIYLHAMKKSHRFEVVRS